MTDYKKILKSYAEKEYADFSDSLLPDTSYPVLGVRVPTIKKIASFAIKNGDYASPAAYEFYEECMLDGLIIASGKSDFDKKTAELDNYLEKADSWGLTDSVAAAFKTVCKNPDGAEKFIYRLLYSGKTYKIRFGIVLLILHFCGDKFKEEHLNAVLKVKFGEYYVDMAVAWYISVLLVKNRDAGMRVVKSCSLPKFVHNKAIQKAIESFRVSDEDKNYLKTLKINNRNTSV